ncbi:hypothetical protein KEM56_002389, partial [Ascosphaera pollenicola]
MDGSGYHHHDGPHGSGMFRSFSVVSNTSMLSSSMVSDVEMAHEEVFDGPISESVPSSSASFIHRRRSRRDSNVSFTFYQEPEEDEDDDEGLSIRRPTERHAAEEDQSDLDASVSMDDEYDLEALAASHEASSGISHVSTPLLGHGTSKRSGSFNWVGETISQKVYLSSEDLTAVITGFTTSRIGFALYLTFCIASFGFGFLLMKWMPRWRVQLIGRPVPLAQADWVVIENEWGQFTTHNVTTEDYDLPLYTLFRSPAKFSPASSPSFDDEYAADISTVHYLDYRYIRFYYHPIEDGFFTNGDWKHPTWNNVKNLREGLNADDRDLRELVFGPNVIDIEQKTVGQILVEEALHPFYIFQVASLVLWSLDQYYYYATCIFVISVFSIGATVLETRSTMRRLRDLSHFECDIRVLRSGFWRSISSRDLVPGDVFEISDPSLSQVPCDCLLLIGDAIVNESMLTGESVPVSKLPANNVTLEALDLNGPSVGLNVAKNFLFSGTKIIRARRPQPQNNGTDDEAVALAMAVRTGFNTTKGALVRSMLFPKPSGFKFYRDSFRYISVMACIAAVGFVASLVNFIQKGLVWNKILYRALDLVTIVVPPALPATLTIGTNFALSRLKKQKIFCISPQRVNVGGMLNIVCFDKTGTLTEDGLDVLGVRAVRRTESTFEELFSDVDSLMPQQEAQRDPTFDYTVHQHILFAMATCHSLRLVDGELLGDPLDLRMFQYTHWSFEEGHNAADPDDVIEGFRPSIARPPLGHRLSVGSIPGPEGEHTELGVIKAFEFASQLRRSSVIVHQEGCRTADVFVKGAPESMRKICRPETLPEDFDRLLGYYTHNGYRVIALASKTIKKYNQAKVLRATRSEVECDLDFLGFIVFENKLKPITADVIKELNEANIRNVMCTGDNILTAISVAKECGMISSDAPCFVPHFVQ